MRNRLDLLGTPGLAVFGVLGSMTIGSPAAAGIVTSWTNPAGGSFSMASNWLPGAPGPFDLALFDLDATFVVDVDGPASVSRLFVRRGEVTLALNGTLAALSSTALAPSVVVGDTAGAPAALTLEGGTIAGTYMDVANAPGSSGDVNVDPASHLALEQTLSIGPRGAGSVVSSGTIECRQFVLGALASGSGMIAVTGPGALLACDDAFVVGQFGDGTMEIADGASATFGEGIVAVDGFATGSLIVRGSGTTMVVDGDLEIGRRNIGVMEVRDGATVTVAGAVLVGVSVETIFIPPFYPAGDGTLVVSGPGSTVTALGEFRAPVQGAATVRVENGGRLSALDCIECGMFGRIELIVGPSTSMDDPAITFGDGLHFSSDDPVDVVDGFVPPFGATYPLVAAPSITTSSAFGLQPLPAPSTWSWSIQLAPEGKRLVVTVSSLADIDNSGTIDGADLGLLLGAWGSTTPGGPGDLDSNGTVDGGDLGLLLGAWQ